MDTPLVSVIMATNRGQADIGPAVAALQAQTYAPIEIVIAIDRETSPAQRAEYAASFPDVRFVFLDKTSYLPTALNAAIAQSFGSILVRCDDDDISHPTRVERQVELLLASDVDFVWTHARGKRFPEDSGWHIPAPAGDEAIKRALLKENVLVHSTLAMKRTSLEKLGLYDTQFRRSQDLELYLRAVRAGLKFGAVDEILLDRVYGATSGTLQSRKHQILFSFAARLLHAAHTNDPEYAVRNVFRYMMLLLIPERARALNRTLRKIRGVGR